MNSDYLKGLNEAQREAVLEHEAPLLVLAGAGSGKTRVITTKIAYLIDKLGCSPWSILAVTFTNKAAAEMKERVSDMVEGASDVMVKTFHAFGAWLLRRNPTPLGLSESFTIYDDEDSVTLPHSLYPKFKRTELKPYARWISRAKDYCLGPGDDLTAISEDKKLPEMYAAYERRLRKIGNVDFGDLIALSVRLLREHPEVARKIRNRFRVILVDEYQDSNVAQSYLIQELYQVGTFVCVVGDDDQSIYRFRGAELANILTFPDRFPGTRIIKLEENYRSTGTILAIASQVVEKNIGRHGKTLWTKNGKGGKATLGFYTDQFAEAQFCADLVSRDHTYDGTAILYRTNAQSAAFETVFMRLNIPYKIIGALRFYDREEVKDTLAVMALCLNPADEIAFRRIVNKPTRGIGDSSLAKILEAAAGHQGDCIEGLRIAIDSQLRGKAKSGAEELLRWYGKALEVLANEDLSEFTKQVLLDSGLLEYHRRQDEVASTQKVNNLEELVNAVSVYPPGRAGLAMFMESLELDPTRLGDRDDADRPGVTLITMHNTKGLEFDRVIITGMEEGLFPGRANDSDEDIEEERRIFYVSITRARKELFFTCCRQRAIWGRTSYQMPSRFLSELPKEHITLRGIPPFGYGFERSDMPDSMQGLSQNRQGSFSSNSRSMTSRRPIAGSIEGKVGRSWPNPPPRDTMPAAGAAFTAGDRVYHDDYGAGYISASKLEHGREVVSVMFDTGRSAKFITSYARLEKIAQD